MTDLSSSTNECQATIFRDQWLSYFLNQKDIQSQKERDAELNVSKIRKYLNLLKSLKSDSCLKAASFQSEVTTYQNVQHKVAGISVTPECSRWCALGSFSYQNFQSQYRNLIPCTPTEQVFKQKLQALNIFD